jgi:hypothetical protein
MFNALPEAWPKLAEALAQRDQESAFVPPETKGLCDRLRSIYDLAKPQGYLGVNRGDIRKFPYAEFKDGAPCLSELHPELSKRYWGVDLPRAVADGGSREKRWLRPLFFTYCSSFEPASTEFRVFAMNLRNVLRKVSGPFGAALVKLHDGLDFFEPSQAPTRLARHLHQSGLSVHDWLAAMSFWPDFFHTQFGLAVFRSYLSLGSEVFSADRGPNLAKQLVTKLPTSVVKSPLRVQFAEALLSPWRRRNPDEDFQRRVARVLLGEYGDPRVDRFRAYQWDGVAEELLHVLMRWLAGETLRRFVSVLEKTADETWKYRQKFWMSYYDAGYVDEAWLALGRDAMLTAKALSRSQIDGGMAELVGASPNQSVLLLRLGHLVFTEWSHNGSLRAYPTEAPGSPKLFSPYYEASDLKSAMSMDFHEGMNERPQLTHANSVGGTWQRKARDFIRKQTGVYLSDREILL